MCFSSWLRSRSIPDAGRRGRARVKSATFRPRLEALEGRDVPSTLHVTNTNDNGPGSLRAEIAAAKNNDTIVIDPIMYGETITLTSGELYISKNVTIEGYGPGWATVSGGGASRVFEVASKVKVTLASLTISNGGNWILASNGLEGGGIFNHGSLAVQGCTLLGNTAQAGGGLANDFGGTLTLAGCTVSDNHATEAGGGIWNAGTLKVSSSRIGSSTDPVTGAFVPGNDSYWGGGIYNLGTATISNNSVISGNSATDGDLGSGYGGGIYNAGNAKLTVSNCSLSGNTAGNLGGGIYNAGSLSVSYSGFSSNNPGNIYGPYVDGGGNVFG